MPMPSDPATTWTGFGRPLAFVICGAVAAVCNLVIRATLNLIVPFEVAVGIAFLSGAAIAFVLYQRFVYGDPGTGLKRQLLHFSVVDIVASGIAIGVSSLLARVIFPSIGWTIAPFALAHCAGVAAPALWSFFAHKHLTFSPAGDGGPATAATALNRENQTAT